MTFRLTWTIPSPSDDQNPIEKTLIEARLSRDDRWRMLFEVIAPQDHIDVHQRGLDELRLTFIDSQGVPSEPALIAVRERRSPPSKPANVTVSAVQ